MSDQLNAEECNIRRFCRVLSRTSSRQQTLSPRWPSPRVRMWAQRRVCNNCTGKPLWCQCINPVRASAAATSPSPRFTPTLPFRFPRFAWKSLKNAPFLAVDLPRIEFSEIRTAGIHSKEYKDFIIRRMFKVKIIIKERWKRKMFF